MVYQLLPACQEIVRLWPDPADLCVAASRQLGEVHRTSNWNPAFVKGWGYVQSAHAYAAAASIFPKTAILETQASRLLCLGELDQVQAGTAWQIAETYGRYDAGDGEGADRQRH